jgi:hypothetical protein
MAGVVTNYESAHTKWMREQMEKHPEWAAEQKAGRSLWWDRAQTVDETARDAESKVANKAYPYDTNFEF